MIIPGSGSGSGNEMFFDIVTADNCTDDSCSYIFSSDSITNSYSVAVEVVGCVTERMDCTNMSSCEIIFCAVLSQKYKCTCSSLYMYCTVGYSA